MTGTAAPDRDAEEPWRGARPQEARLLPTAWNSQAEVREIRSCCTCCMCARSAPLGAREMDRTSRTPLPSDCSVRTIRVGSPTRYPHTARGIPRPTQPPRGSAGKMPAAPARLAACTGLLTCNRALIHDLRGVGHLIVSIKRLQTESWRRCIMVSTPISQCSGRGSEKELYRACKHDRVLRAAGKDRKKTHVTKSGDVETSPARFARWQAPEGSTRQARGPWARFLMEKHQTSAKISPFDGKNTHALKNSRAQRGCGRRGARVRLGARGPSPVERRPLR